jgi:diguanylate cyclase (GGDEF)-like protein/PAS domain S-box-containing protein
MLTIPRTLVVLSFVADFTSLLLFGPRTAIAVAVGRSVVEALVRLRGTADPIPSSHALSMVVSIAVALATMQATGFTYATLGASYSFLATWPLRALPIAVAAIVYGVVKNAFTYVVVPLCSRQTVARVWPKQLVLGWPIYLIAGSIAVVLAALIEHRLWEIVPAAALPLYLSLRAYGGHMKHLDEDRQRQEVLESLDEGMCVLDVHGRVTLWNEALAELTGCTREQAVGRSLATAVPSLRDSALPKAIKETLKDRTSQTIESLLFADGTGTKTFQVKVLPMSGGTTLLWHDMTERLNAVQALKRTEERLTLAAEVANDGLWEWDLRTGEFYHSGRWKAMLGLAAPFDIGRPEDWFDRVHADDLPALKETLEAHLSGKAKTFEHEHRIRHEDGTYRRFMCRGLAVRGAGRRAIRVAGSLTDTTEQAKAQEQIRNAAFVDPLTGLCNRAVFVERLGRRLEEFRRRPLAGRFAVLYLDLDRFKIVNDSLGHLIGDELLVAVSRRLEACLRQGDALARLGGDEFAILLNGLSDEQQANAIAFRIQESLSGPFSIGGREVFTSASIGIACGSTTYSNPDEIMRDADTAMYHAKSHGKARHELFDADMHLRARDRLGLENDLRRASAAHDFEVRYQPIVSLKSGMCIGFESLVRWSRNGEQISPAVFIPIAEELGLIEPIGTWVMQEACKNFADWQRRYKTGTLDCITVNVSSRQLVQQNFLFTVEQAVKNSGLEPASLRIEITETALMESPGEAAEVLRELRNFGAKIYLDDFGTGYSSLSHLAKLPVDALKIDRSFVRSLLIPDRPAIVESILALARTLNTSVVAEGIETEVEARELERLGCTHAQGFLFSRPLTRDDAEKLIVNNQPLGPKQVLTSRAAAVAV